MIAGDKKPQWRRRILSTGGLVSIKNSCQKRDVGGVGGPLERSGLQVQQENRQQEEKKSEEAQVYYVNPFIARSPRPTPDRQPAGLHVTPHKTGLRTERLYPESPKLRRET